MSNYILSVQFRLCNMKKASSLYLIIKQIKIISLIDYKLFVLNIFFNVPIILFHHFSIQHIQQDHLSFLLNLMAYFY